MTLHNPSNVTPEQVGDGWRLLTTDEITKPLPKDAEFWCIGTNSWWGSCSCGMIATKSDQKETTYRTREPLPASPLVAKLNAEIEEKKELLEIVNCIEAGAEWEVQWYLRDSWEEPLQTLDWYFVHSGNWKIRLKPAPELAPLWDCAKDVPMNCRMRKVGDKDGWTNPGHAYSPGIELNAFIYPWYRMDEWEYTLDGETWHECRKGGSK